MAAALRADGSCGDDRTAAPAAAGQSSANAQIVDVNGLSLVTGVISALLASMNHRRAGRAGLCAIERRRRRGRRISVRDNATRSPCTMKNTFFVAIAMVVIGAAILGYEQYTYTTTEQVLKIGPITATAEKTHTVALPAILGWILVGGGICVFVFGAISKKD
jgi:hypothetical protein